MDFINSGIFWMIEGVLLCVSVAGFKIWMEDRAVGLSLWKWALFIIWVCLFGITIAFVGTSLGEGEVIAATRGGLLFGLLTAISGVGLWWLLNSGNKPNDQ